MMLIPRRFLLKTAALAGAASFLDPLTLHAAESYEVNPDPGLIEAPHDPALWPMYREQLARWREAKRRELNYSDALYRRDEFACAPSNYDFLIANDHWFRGVNLKYGPDGSVYLIDWYDKQACHRREPEIWARTNGRVYNVKYRGVESRETRDESQRRVTDLARLSDAELVKLHANPNEWQVRMARRLLQERAEAVRLAPPNAGLSATQAQTPGLLMDFFRQTPDVTRKLRALWTLHAMFGVLEKDRHEMRRATGPDSEYIRAWLIQLEAEQRDVQGMAWTRFVEMANSADEQPLVRLALASALQRMPLDERWEIAAGLLSHAEDADDHNLPLMYWYGIEPLVAADPARAVLLAKASKIEKVSRFIVRRAASTNKTVNAAVEWLATASDVGQQQMLLDEMRLALEGRVNIPRPAAWAPAYDKLQRALDLLIRGRDTQAAPALRAALNEAALRAPAIRALAAYDDPATSPAILSLYAKLDEAEKRDAINTLVARTGSANKLFDAVERGHVPRTDVHAYHVQQLLGFKDDALAKRITSTWGEVRATAKDKLELIARHKTALTSARLKSADLSNGRRLFAKTCSACHVLFGEGGKIGPDITGSNRTNLDYILENLLDPSAIVFPGIAKRAGGLTPTRWAACFNSVRSGRPATDEN